MTDAETHEQPEPNAGRRLARSGSLNFAGLLYFGAMNMVLVVVVSRGLGSGRAGALFTSIAVFNVLLRALVFGCDIGLVRFVSRWIALGRAREVHRLWVPALAPVAVVAVLAAIGVAFGADALAQAFGSEEFEVAIAQQLRVLAPVLPFAVVYFSLESASRGFGTMKPSVAIEKVGKVTLQLGFVTWAVVTDAGPRQIAAAWGVPIVVAFVAMSAWLIGRQRRLARVEPSDAASSEAVPASRREIASEFWRFSGPRAPAGVFQSALLWSESIFIGALASTRDAGIYTAATRFLIVSTLMQLAIGQTLQPLLSAALARHDRATAEDVFRSATAWAMLLSWPVLVGVIIYAPTLLKLYPDDYGKAASTIALLAAVWMIAVACGPVDNVLLMAGRSWLTTLNVIAAFAVSVGLSVALIPPLGMFGAAIAWCASLLVNNLLPLFQVRKYVNISPFGPMMRHVLVPVAGFAIALGGTRLVLGTTVVSMVVGAVLAAAVYAMLVRPRREELRLGDLLAGVRRSGRRG